MNFFADAVRMNGADANGWHNLGTALKKLGDRQSALGAFKRALQLNPDRADTYLNLGNLLIEAGELEDAVESFERAAECDPMLAAARCRLAEQISQRGNVVGAEALFRQCVTLDTANLHGWFGLGRTLEDIGDAQGALGCYRNVLTHRPDHAPALGQYLALCRDTAPESVLSAANEALNDAECRDELRALIGYGLAKYYDRRGEFGTAARAATEGNAARRRSSGALDRDALRKRVDGLIRTYDADFFFERRGFGLGSEQPVFIIGLPRSGTTLCEQILASHPRLHGAGELPELARLAVVALDGDDAPPWQAAKGLSLVRSRELGIRYLRALRNGAQKQRERISDKSPLNFFQLAFAAVLFPNARVIHCTRDARDNALSIWMENFNPDHAYATEFHDLAFYREQYQRLMAHWGKVLPLRILEFPYEAMVEDPYAQARTLVEFLGVSWNDRCLEFHRNERAVQTPSRWQVREPVYSRSVGRWQHYAEHVPQLLSAFP